MGGSHGFSDMDKAARQLEISSKYWGWEKLNVIDGVDCVQPTDLVLFVLEPYSEFGIFQKVV